MTDVPTIETSRLQMRGPTLNDFEAVAAFYASDRSSPLGGPFSRREAWAKFAAQSGTWHLRGYGAWQLVEKASGELVGCVGIFHPDGWLAPELGWVLYDNGCGKDYAYEAATAARAHWYTALNKSDLISTISPDNARSIALAARLSATHECDWDSPYGTTGVYRHPAPEALQ